MVMGTPIPGRLKPGVWMEEGSSPMVRGGGMGNMRESFKMAGIMGRGRIPLSMDGNLLDSGVMAN